MLASVLVNEMFGQLENVRPPLTERRQIDREYVEAVIKVFAKDPFAYRPLKVLVCCRDEAHIRLDRFGPAEAFVFALLKHPQQLDLSSLAQLANLIKKERSAFSHFEAALLAAAGSGKGALLIAEQLRLDQTLGKGGTGYLYEGLACPRRIVVN